MNVSFAIVLFAIPTNIDHSVSEQALEDWLKDVDARVQYGMDFGKERGFLKPGNPVVVVTGWKQGSGFTNTIRIVYVYDGKMIAV